MATLVYDVALDGAFAGRVAIAVRAAYARALAAERARWPRESYTVLWGDAPEHAHGAAETMLFRAPAEGRVVSGASTLALVRSVRYGIARVSNVALAQSD
jgi:hypothetical protein